MSGGDGGLWWTDVRPDGAARPRRSRPVPPGWRSALPPAGGSQARLRAQWEPRFPLPCGQCGGLIQPGEPWTLGHRVPRSAGGTDEPGNLWPEHRRCSDSSGGRLGAAAAAARRAEAPGAVALPPSREW